jgi:geranylgeranyl transferase type-1 subunit beta
MHSSLTTSFSTVPGSGETDLRTLYCAFVIAHLLDDWSSINLQHALSFIASCRVSAWGGFHYILFLFAQRQINSLMKADTASQPIVKLMVRLHVIFDVSLVYIDGCFLGGTTYIAVAAMELAPVSPTPLTSLEKGKTIEWALHNQLESGGFCGRTNKLADACYCFWIGGSLKVSFQVLLLLCLETFSLLDPRRW